MSGYFDHNATTPLHPAARDAWLAAAERFWHNPSSLYREAAAVKEQLEHARERLAELLGCEPGRIVFTSGATESNHAFFRALAAKLPAQVSVLTSSVEHPSVRTPLRLCFGERVNEVRTLPDTTLDRDDFDRRLRDSKPALVSIMAANNECGVLLPWRELANACRDRGVPFHSDATQWIGKLPAQDLGRCDYVTGSAHKFGGPKGCGFLVLKDEEEALCLVAGGPQESGHRAGTENYPAIEAMVTALETLTPRLEEIAGIQAPLRDEFVTLINERIPGTRAVGEGTSRLWNTVMLIMPRHDNRKWLARLSQQGFAISTGSACSAGSEGASQVLQAVGATPEEMRQVLRISGGWDTTATDWDRLAGAMTQVWHGLEAKSHRTPVA
jgi:cysteine desulfurase